MTTILHQAVAGGSDLTPASIANLASGGTSGVSGIFDNTTPRHLFADFVVDLTLATGMSAYASIGFFIVASVDAANFETQSRYLNDQLFAVHPPISVTSVRRIIPRVPIPPLYFRLYAFNGTAVALGATNTVSIRPSSIEHS